MCERQRERRNPMRIRSIVFAGLGVGAVALALAGCTRTALGEGTGQGGGQGYHGARYEQDQENQVQSARGNGRGQQAPSAESAASGALRGTGNAGRSEARAAVDPASDRTGRDVADAGTLRNLSGTLASDGTEWYLDALDGRYLLHLGNASYIGQTGLVLEAGKTAAVKGLVAADEVSVISLQVGGETYTFRSEDGRPLWAGGGRGAGRGGQGSGRGSGFGA
jgi:hypothetical protein